MPHIIAQNLFRTHWNIYDGAFFAKNSYWLKIIDYLCKNYPPQTFDWVSKKLFIFCGRHNCMIPNVKKVLFLALALVLKRNHHPHIFKMKNNLKYFLIFKGGTKTIANLYSSKYYRGEKKLKIFQERPHLLSSCFIRRPPAQDDVFEWSEE